MNNITHLEKSIPVSILKRKHPVLTIQSEFDKAMGYYFNRWLDFPSFLSERFEDLTLYPSMDVIDDKEHFKIEVEMPGMGEEDVKISISDGVLMIKGEKTTSKQDKDKNYLMREINYGSYERNVTLPDSVDISKTKATFKKGMLWVDIPKKSEVVKQSREIKVEKAA